MSAVMPPVMTDRQRVIGFVLCIATILLAVLDTNIVSSATVPIVSDLDPAHGVDKIPWLIAAYQLAATAALPLYGKLCDVLGTKKVFIGAVATFLAGSALCGMAGSMGGLTGHAHQQALDAFVSSTNVVFWSATGVMILASVLATRLPGRRKPEPADANSAAFTATPSLHR